MQVMQQKRQRLVSIHGGGQLSSEPEVLAASEPLPLIPAFGQQTGLVRE